MITQISRYFLDGEFARTYKIYKMRNAIDKLENHTIICGFGRNGQEAVRILERNREPFVVIEQDEQILEDKNMMICYIFVQMPPVMKCCRKPA